MAGFLARGGGKWTSIACLSYKRRRTGVRIMPTRMVVVNVDAEGGFVIPAEMREELGLKDGDQLTAWVVDGSLYLAPVEAAAKRD
jgi:AbrB family looped-hinge helix DNA binding protein